MKPIITFSALKMYLLGVLSISPSLLSQSITVKGNITAANSMDTISVRYASVVFTDKNDTSKKFSAVTDTSGNYQIDFITTVEQNLTFIPNTFELEQNYPNPFSTSTAIAYTVNTRSNVHIRIYNILGQVIKTWSVVSQAAGSHELLWEGRDNFGKKVSPGIYFYQMRTGKEMQVKKMVFSPGSTYGNAIAAANIRRFSNVPSQTNNFKKTQKAKHFSVVAGTYTVQMKNIDSNTTPSIYDQQFNDVVINSDTILNFALLPDCGNPFEIVPSSSYDNPIWHPGGELIGFNHIPLLKTEYPGGILCIGNQYFVGDSSGFWIINADGTGMRRILPYKLQTPSWSPDGNWIAFVSGAQIFKMGFTGTGFDTATITQLTFDGSNFFPAWSPDGEWIAYDSNSDSPNGMNFIWKMKSDGSQKRRISYEPTMGEIRMPHWSPDSRKIVHIRYLVGTSSEEIFIMDSSGANPLRLTFNNIIDRYPKYSPNGMTIAIRSNGNLWLIDTTGGNLRKLTNRGVGFAVPFSWSPSGNKIIYNNYRSDSWSMKNGVLWLLDVQSGIETQFTFNP